MNIVHLRRILLRFWPLYLAVLRGAASSNTHREDERDVSAGSRKRTSKLRGAPSSFSSLPEEQRQLMKGKGGMYNMYYYQKMYYHPRYYYQPPPPPRPLAVPYVQRPRRKGTLRRPSKGNDDSSNSNSNIFGGGGGNLRNNKSFRTKSRYRTQQLPTLWPRIPAEDVPPPPSTLPPHVMGTPQQPPPSVPPPPMVTTSPPTTARSLVPTTTPTASPTVSVVLPALAPIVPRCDGPTAALWGPIPHVQTLDGLSFDVPAAHGDFTLLQRRQQQSDDNGVAVLQLQASLRRSGTTTRNGAVTTAVALRIGGGDDDDVIEINLARRVWDQNTGMWRSSCAVNAWRDQRPVDLSSDTPQTLASSSSLRWSTTTATLELETDGLSVTLQPIESGVLGCYFNVFVCLDENAASSSSSVSGLLGNTPNGNPNDDWHTADGITVPIPADRTGRAAYEYAAENWCVSSSSDAGLFSHAEQPRSSCAPYQGRVDPNNQANDAVRVICNAGPPLPAARRQACLASGVVGGIEEANYARYVFRQLSLSQQQQQPPPPPPTDRPTLASITTLPTVTVPTHVPIATTTGPTLAPTPQLEDEAANTPLPTATEASSTEVPVEMTLSPTQGATATHTPVGTGTPTTTFAPTPRLGDEATDHPDTLSPSSDTGVPTSTTTRPTEPVTTTMRPTSVKDSVTLGPTTATPSAEMTTESPPADTGTWSPTANDTRPLAPTTFVPTAVDAAPMPTLGNGTSTEIPTLANATASPSSPTSVPTESPSVSPTSDDGSYNVTAL